MDWKKTKIVKSLILNHKRLCVIIAIAVAAVVWYVFALPARLFDKPTATIITDSKGRMLGARIAADEQWRFPAPDSLPTKYVNAVILFEDKRFRHHPGVDAAALGRALWQNIRKGRVVSGGSTVTMQVIRLMQDNPPRNFLQKAKEAILATRLELRCSKDEIMRLYAANAPFGGNVVGLGAASWRYFGREPTELSWAEAATLAVLPNAPSLIHPGRNREILFNKRNKLLDKLAAEGFLSAEDCALAKDEPLPAQPHPLPAEAPHLLDQVAAIRRGQRVVTTIDMPLQTRINQIVARYAASYRGNFVFNMAVVVAEVESGNVLAYIGNTNKAYGDKGNQVDVIQAPRSTGSILKPFLYATMLDHGELLPNTLVADVPIQIRNFAPKNYDRKFDGAVPAQRALQRSLNVPAVRMLQTHGIERFHQLLRRLGMSTLTLPPDHYGLTLILGGAEGKLWDIAGMYASLARTLNHFEPYMGRYNPADLHSLNFLKSAETISPQTLPSKELDREAPIDAGAIWETFQTLADLNRPEEEATWKNFSSTQKIAWKTGTSYGLRDAWAVGVTPRYVVGVWVGNASGEGRPTLTGVNYAAPVLFEVFAALPQSKWFAQPLDDMTRLVVCRTSGYRASEACTDTDTVWAPHNGAETGLCPYHTIIHLDKSGRYRVNSECYSVNDMRRTSWFVLPPAMEWFYKSQNPDYKPLPPILPGCIGSETKRQMELLYPQAGLSVLLPRQLDGSEGKVIFRAAHRRRNATIFWHIDHEYVGQTQAPHQIALAPTEGKHILTLIDEQGEKISERFNLISAETDGVK